ncbi:hypothetical protein [Pseudomonas sp. WS 5079]|uniref:hypothetical protein n=1 Tax=Pseudomonas sp. WS 5079 TaxID=2717492 RepID=UPI0015567067|nr:hypothetical protein [Pseudomonas sp. WS 5079]NMX65540.1 hypothetical protein [Pseudomonas sp. WS 5079]
MTYVREQSSTELAVHMRSLQKMPGWHDPLADRLWQEVEALKAEVAGLRTGYEAYERVKAELKAENERLERNRDMWKGQVDRQCETIEGLRKALKAAEDAMWHADGNMDGEAADARDALADLGQGEQS